AVAVFLFHAFDYHRSRTYGTERGRHGRQSLFRCHSALQVQAGPRRNSARDHAPFSERALSWVFVKTAAVRIFIAPDGYRLESHERGGSATLILPAGKRNVVMVCIRFGIFSRCHTVDMGCTTPAYQ